MDYLSIPLRARAAKRAKDPVNFAKWPAAVGGIWTREGKGSRFCGNDGLAFVEEGECGFRFVGASGKILSNLRHRGWYVDNQHGETTMGVVYRLPHGRFVAGASDPWNCDKRGEGPFLLENSVFDCPEEAARRADRIAELYAERLREDDLKFQAEREIEDAKEEISGLRESIRELISGIRESSLAPSVCNQLRRDIRRLRGEIRDCWKRIRTLQETPWEIVCR